MSAWICPWCEASNDRENAGEDRCDGCGAVVFTEYSGFEKDGLPEIRVRHSSPAPSADYPELL